MTCPVAPGNAQTALKTGEGHVANGSTATNSSLSISCPLLSTSDLSSPSGAATVTFSPIGLALVRVFHFGERNPGVLFAGIFEVEGVACQENQIAIEILRDC